MYVTKNMLLQKPVAFEEHIFFFLVISLYSIFSRKADNFIFGKFQKERKNKSKKIYENHSEYESQALHCKSEFHYEYVCRI